MAKRDAEDPSDDAAEAKRLKKEKRKLKESKKEAKAAAEEKVAKKSGEKEGKKNKLSKEEKLAKKAKKEAKKAKSQGTEEKATTDDDSAKATSPTTQAEEATSDLPATIDSFDKAPFSPKMINALKAAFDAPTPIQAQAWPIAVAGSDLIAVAKTGSGKTLGFLLPALHANADCGPCNSGPKVLVMAPTRELALQINGECEKFAPMAGCSSVAVYGGAPWGAQLSAIKEDAPAIIVATPGRLCDFLNRGSLSISSASYVVLDEADRMLDMGFEPQIKQIFAALPTKRQTLFFTATWPKSVRKLAATWLRSGDDLKQVFIGTEPDAELEANKAISQKFIEATDDEKDEKLYNWLGTLDQKARVVVFANTKRRVDACARNFAEFGSVAIHGDKQQRERDQALASFTKGDYPLMFATDVAARGLDIKGVTHVFNFDMARDVESYVHRIGRTGRAGELGAAVTFWNPDYDKECTPALCKIARDAGQEVPEWLAKHEKNKAGKTWRVDKAEAALAAVTA